MTTETNSFRFVASHENNVTKGAVGVGRAVGRKTVVLGSFGLAQSARKAGVTEMKMNNVLMSQWSISLWVAAVLFLFAGSAVAELPEPDHIYYGTPTVFGVAPTEGEITAVLEGDPMPLATFQVEDLAALGGRFVLRIPIDSVDPRRPGTARPGETLNFFINSELAGTKIIGERGTATLLTLDPSLASSAVFAIDDVSFFEGDATDGPGAVFTVTLSEALDADVTVDWTTGDPGAGSLATGSAAASCAAAGGADYLQDNDVLTFGAGVTSAMITIETCGDLVIEPDEVFKVQLSNASGASIFDAEGIATLRDDDTPPVVSVNDVIAQEPDNGETVQAVFSVTLDHPWKDPVAFSYATADGTATVADGDYVAAANSDVIPVGAVATAIVVTVNGDNTPEGQENFFLNLSSPTNGATLGDGIGEAMILDEQFLLFQETQDNGAGGIVGLDGPVAVALSPADDFLYAASGDAIVVFSRNGDGTLNYLESHTDDVGGVNGLHGVADLLVSPDGEHLYAVGELDDALVIFDRNTTTGLLTFDSALFTADFPTDADVLMGGMALTMNVGGEHLYVAGTNSVPDPDVHWLAALTRNDVTGALTLVEVEKGGVNDPSDPGGEVTPFQGPESLSMSPDGEHLYVACRASSSVAVFSRETAAGGTFGSLNFQSAHEDGASGVSTLAGAAGVDVSPDGKHVYVAAADDNGIGIFARDTNAVGGTFGNLTFLGAVVDGTGTSDGLLGATKLAVTPDRGDVLYVVSQLEPHPDPGQAGAGIKGALAAYMRDSTTGLLTFIEMKIDNFSGVDGLWQASNLAVSGDDQSVYAAGTQDDAIAVFQRDVLAPNDPTAVTSNSHTLSTWSNETIVAMQWSGATDNGHVGLDGYSVLFDLADSTLPDVTVDVAHVEDPHVTSSAALGDSDSHYFHLRTCDNADNCTSTVHVGPFFVDGTAPTDPSTLISTSHTVGVESTDSRVEVEWSGASDALSGLDGYSFFFESVATGTTSTTAQCLETQMLDHTADPHTLLSSPLPNGTYFFHVCALDVAGNWSAGANLGPFLIATTDTAAPTVTLVDTVAQTDGIGLVDLEETGAGLSQVLVSFSEPMFDPADPLQVNAVRNPDNYRLVAAAANTTLETTTCGAVDPDDTQIGIDKVLYDGGTSIAALFLAAEGVALPDGQTLLPDLYRLILCGDANGLLDPSGNILDGDANGSATGDFVLDFTVVVKDLLLNPNFDFGDLSFWIDSPTGTPDVAPDSTIDVGAAPTSGSVVIEVVGSSVGNVFGIEQCVSLTPTLDEFELSGWVRTVLTNSPAAGPSAVASAQFFTGTDCDSGPLGGAVQTTPVVGSTAGGWMFTTVRDFVVPATAGSALVSFVLDRSADATADFESFFDDLFFGEERPLDPPFFADGFESGDTSAWE